MGMSGNEFQPFLDFPGMGGIEIIELITVNYVINYITLSFKSTGKNLPIVHTTLSLIGKVTINQPEFFIVCFADRTTNRPITCWPNVAQVPPLITSVSKYANSATRLIVNAISHLFV